jgi:hypothetical protein
MGSLVPFSRKTALVTVTRHGPPAARRQLDLLLDDARLRGLSATERRSALQALAHLLLEANGVAVPEVGHEHE